jgi:hypothetical protein
MRTHFHPASGSRWDLFFFLILFAEYLSATDLALLTFMSVCLPSFLSGTFLFFFTQGMEYGPDWKVVWGSILCFFCFFFFGGGFHFLVG